jgi:hypothetical protein
VVAAADALAARSALYRDWHRAITLATGRRQQAALHAGLGDHGPVQVAPWFDAKHRAPLAEDPMLERAAREHLGALQAELAGLVEPVPPEPAEAA